RATTTPRSRKGGGSEGEIDHYRVVVRGVLGGAAAGHVTDPGQVRRRRRRQHVVQPHAGKLRSAALARGCRTAVPRTHPRPQVDEPAGGETPDRPGVDRAAGTAVPRPAE